MRFDANLGVRLGAIPLEQFDRSGGERMRNNARTLTLTPLPTMVTLDLCVAGSVQSAM
jgi:hypothetical protein